MCVTGNCACACCQLHGIHVRSDARDRLLYALCRMLDALVDVVAAVARSRGGALEGVDASVRDDVFTKLSGLLSGTADANDLFAMSMVSA